MRIAVVEDERVVARRLVRMLREILEDRVEAIEALPTLDEALAFIVAHPIDVLFLDLNLHGADGFRLLEAAAAGPFETIVVSAHADQAIRAFEHGVVDFVPKPYSRDRLVKALGRLGDREPPLRERLKTLAVRKGSDVLLLPLEQILYISGADDYAEIHCRDGGTHLHTRTLSALSRQLPAAFLRVHRSHLVRVDAVERLRHDEGRLRLTMADGHEIPVSRTRAQAVRDVLHGR